MKQFIIELRSLLQKTLIWSEEFKRGNRDYSFDVDNEIYELSIKYSKDFGKGDLNLLYNLLDFYCDAIKHGFKEIDKNYSILKAQSDIKVILNVLENSFVITLPNDIKNRLKSI